MREWASQAEIDAGGGSAGGADHGRARGAGAAAWTGSPAAPRGGGGDLPGEPSPLREPARALRARGSRLARGRKRLARLSRERGLRARAGRPKHPRTTDSRRGLPAAENRLARCFQTEAPNLAWVGDSRRFAARSCSASRGAGSYLHHTDRGSPSWSIRSLRATSPPAVTRAEPRATSRPISPEFPPNRAQAAASAR